MFKAFVSALIFFSSSLALATAGSCAEADLPCDALGAALELTGPELLAEDFKELIDSIKDDFKPSIAFESIPILSENSEEPNLTFAAIFSTALTMSDVNSDSDCNGISGIIFSLELRQTFASKIQSSDFCSPLA